MLQQHAWKLLDSDGAILRVARELSRILRQEGIRAAIVGGLAVRLHGHRRTTSAIDVYVPPPLESFAEALRRRRYTYDARKKEFRRSGVPVHIVTDDETGGPPQRLSRIDDITTVSLADLINMKLLSGTSSVLRAQDLADVIALIRTHRLDGRFTPRIAPKLRPEYRKLLRALKAQGR